MLRKTSTVTLTLEYTGIEDAPLTKLGQTHDEIVFKLGSRSVMILEIITASRRHTKYRGPA